MTTLAVISDAMRMLVDAAAQRVVAIDVNGRSAASGVLWRDGLVVSAEEAIADEERFEVTLPDGRAVEATLAGRDPSTDVALLRLADTSGAVEPPALVNDVAAGELVLAIGRGRNGAIAASGLVKESGGSWRSWAGGTIDRRVLLDLALDRRAHGGAVIDAEGRLVGLAAFAPRRQALVIPAETVARIAARLETTGSIARGYLGAGLHPLAAAAGAIIVSLDDSGPARHAGLHVGDILTRWNGEPIRGVHDVFRRLGPDTVGESVTLDVMRADQQTQVTVAVAARPHK